MISRLWVRICEYLKLTNKRFWNHLLDFWVVWVLLFVILVFSWAVHWVPWVKYVVYISAVLFVVYMLYKPMATVYGLIGGSANILNFFFYTLKILNDGCKSKFEKKKIIKAYKSRKHINVACFRRVSEEEFL